MPHYPPVNFLHDKLIQASQKQLTGRLEVQSGRGKGWELYFCVGYLSWVSGDWHRIRRFRRQLKAQKVKIDWNLLSGRDNDDMFPWDFQAIQLLKKRGIITEKQVFEIVDSIAIEVFFDILLSGINSDLSYTTNLQEDTLLFLKMPSFKLSIKSIFSKVEKQIDTWIKSDLASISPNDAPLIKHSKSSIESTNKLYQKIAAKMNGKRTLREISQGFKTDTFKLTNFITPYIRKGWIEIIEVPDISYQSIPRSKLKVSKIPEIPLIACIDDSIGTIKTIEPIVKTAGYRFLAIQDSLKAVLTLIETKPDLIFLDLVMPVANGYEICTQLRRISQFSKTPIIILTSSKGTIPRMRATAAKASGFLSKPIHPQKVLAVIRKYLGKLDRP
ncbi:response regulator [Oscillatoriales cyanobacterium LEGE 11467]|uniref:Protein PatA n=1 Tax=Zarconia navalis LEGE 11467 TaxID=1828826 RepID=A0A928VXR6_9CYAN|nr:response regulator [Zarconia navalis]MBE9042147.1 response regulator [Zarconia navalis LEGE 11467]